MLGQAGGLHCGRGTQTTPQAPSLHRYRPGCWEACLARCRRSRTNAWASRSPFRLSSSCRIGSPAKRGVCGSDSSDAAPGEWPGLWSHPVLPSLGMGPPSHAHRTAWQTKRERRLPSPWAAAPAGTLNPAAAQEADVSQVATMTFSDKNLGPVNQRVPRFAHQENSNSGLAGWL